MSVYIVEWIDSDNDYCRSVCGVFSSSARALVYRDACAQNDLLVYAAQYPAQDRYSMSTFIDDYRIVRHDLDLPIPEKPSAEQLLEHAPLQGFETDEYQCECCNEEFRRIRETYGAPDDTYYERTAAVSIGWDRTYLCDACLTRLEASKAAAVAADPENGEFEWLYEGGRTCANT